MVKTNQKSSNLSKKHQKPFEGRAPPFPILREGLGSSMPPLGL